MARPIYSHELSDPDFNWLVSSYKEANPCYTLVDLTGIPLIFIVDGSHQPPIPPTHLLPAPGRDSKTPPASQE